MLQKNFQFRRRHRLAKIVALHPAHAHLLEDSGFGFVLHSFSDNLQAERARQIDDSLGDAAAFLGLKIARKFHIDLQLAHGHYVQTAQRGVALAKIVNGQPEAMLGKLLQPFGLRRQAQQRLAFRQFKDQMLRLNSKLFDQVPHVREKLRLEHLPYGNIDRKRQRNSSFHPVAQLLQRKPEHLLA